MSEERTLWFLMLEKEFLNRRAFKLLEGMPNGYAYEIFYMKLMLESLATNGIFYNTEEIPMDAPALAAITNMNVDVVRCALPILVKLGLIEIMEDLSLYVVDVPKMTGQKSGSPEAIRQRLCRERKKEKAKKESLECYDTRKIGSVTECHDDVTEPCDTSVTNCHDINIYNYNNTKSNTNTDNLESNLELSKEEEEKNISIIVNHAPAREEVERFISDKCPHVSPNGFYNYYQKLDWCQNGEPIHDWRLVALKWEENLCKPAQISTKEFIKMLSDYRNAFGVSVPPQYFNKPIMVKTAIATQTPLEDYAT